MGLRPLILSEFHLFGVCVISRMNDHNRTAALERSAMNYLEA